jgi:hypothetical protein
MLAETIVPGKRLLVCLPAPGDCLGTQPQRDVLRLHRLPNHSHQIVAQGIEIRLVPELCGEALESLSRMLLIVSPP